MDTFYVEASFVDPICFSFLNPITKKKKYLYININHELPFYDKIGKVTEMALKKLAGEINMVHEELIMSQEMVLLRDCNKKECDPKWIEPHLCQRLPSRQGNGVVWEGFPPDPWRYWRRNVTPDFLEQRMGP